MKVQSPKDLISGLVFLSTGLIFALGALSYPLGKGSRMGPGYFPLMLGAILAILGSAIALKAILVKADNGDKVGPIAWKSLILIILANLVFGIMLGGLPVVKLPAMGLIPGIYALILIASLASDEFRLKETLILATALSVGSYLIFNVLLALRFPLWPAFIAS